MRKILGWVVLLLLLLGARPAEAGDRTLGHQVASRWCASCHLMEGRGQASDGALPLETLAAKPHVTLDYLHAFLTKPHGRMPDLQLSRNEIKNLVDYILGLRGS